MIRAVLALSSLRLSHVLHDLNPWGGQERCALEVARRLSHRWPVDTCGFTPEGTDLRECWADMRFRSIRPHLEHPEPQRSTCFHAATAPILWADRRGGSKALVHAAGRSSLVSDIVHVHFVCSAPKAIRANLPERLRLPALPGPSGGG